MQGLEIMIIKSKIIILAIIVLFCGNANAGWLSTQDKWEVKTKSNSGPLIQVDIPSYKGKNRVVFIAFEYVRRCDPIFSFAEIEGRSFGRPISKKVLKNSKIGIVVNGSFHTSNAALVTYDNGYEAGFGIPNSLVLQLLVALDSLSYVAPSGDVIPLPKKDFKKSFLEAIEFCRQYVN